MNELYLYELMSENEDDPYCSHWFDTDFQTHNRDKACEKILEWKRKQINNDSLTLTDIKNRKDFNNLFYGFMEVSKYDATNEMYIFDHREYLSKYQLNYDCIDYTQFEKEFVEFFSFNDGRYLEKTFNFPIKAKFIDGSEIKTHMDFTVYKRKIGDDNFGNWIICVEGIKYMKEFLNLADTYNLERYSGIFDPANSYHTNTVEGIIQFGHNIVHHWSHCNNNLFNEKFIKAVHQN